MPACYQLIPKGSNEPMSLHAVDAQLVWHFRDANPYNPWLKQHGQSENHESRWFADWHNVIGFLLATGSNFEQIRAKLADWTDDAQYRALLTEICNYLEAQFHPDFWTEWGRR